MFRKLLKLTKLVEEKDFCPLVICGMFCNTDGENAIDFEFCGCGKPSGFMFDDDDLKEALNGAGVAVSDFEKSLEIIVGEFAYYDEEADEYLSAEAFRARAVDYINSNEWEDGGKPSVSEVMENMDNITKVEW